MPHPLCRLAGRYALALHAYSSLLINVTALAQLIVSGVSELDLKDWEAHTDYRGYTRDDQVVRWFWQVRSLLSSLSSPPTQSVDQREAAAQVVGSWDLEKKARLLQFTTGTSRVPVNGFKDLQGSDGASCLLLRPVTPSSRAACPRRELTRDASAGPRRFTIEKSGEITQLPKSHTCFNRIETPPYPTYEMLEQKLTFAIENTMGFALE